MNKHITSTSFPKGLDELRTLEEVRAQRAGTLTMVDVIARGPYKPPVHKSCPFCREIPEGHARRIGDTFVVGCDSDQCERNRVSVQASGDTPELAWAAWDSRL